MKRTIISLLISCTALFAGIGQDDWVETGQMLRYPADQYFYAVGSGASPEAARTNAIAEVRKQISATIESSEISRISDEYGTSGHTHESTYRQRTRISSQGDIQGVNIIATAEQDGDHYAFGVLEKEIFEKNIRATIQEQIGELADVYAKAEESMAEPDFPTGLSHLSSAREIHEKYVANRLLLTAVGTPTDAEKSPISAHDIQALYIDALSALNTEKTGGDRQEIPTGNTPEDPFVLTVTAQGEGVENIPFILTDRDGREVLRQFSDAEGMVYFYLSDRAQTRRGVHRYTATPDFPQAPPDLLGRIEQTFAYRVVESPAYANIKATGPSDVPSDELNQQVINLLGDYDIRHEDCNCLHLDVAIQAEKGEYVQGVSRSRTFRRATVQAAFTLTEKKSGRVVSQFSASSGGMGNDFQAAIFDALGNMKLGSDIRTMKETLESPQNADEEATPSEEPTIIVFPFTNSEYIANWRNISESLYGMITTRLINTNAVSVLERENIARLIEEQQFSSESIDMAKYLGADLAIFGTASLSGGVIEIDARIVDVESGVSRGAVSASGKNLSQLRSLANLLVEEMKIDGVSLVDDSSQTDQACCR
jgi:TolB-like protein